MKEIKLLFLLGDWIVTKNHQFLIESLNKMESKYKFNLLILGNGYLEKFLKNLIKKYELNDYVKILNYQYNPYPYINNSDGLILSSFYEGYPNVLIESGALNKIIISSNCKSGPKEILNKNKNGYLFKTNDFNSFKMSLIKFYKNKNNQKKFKI